MSRRFIALIFISLIYACLIICSAHAKTSEHPCKRSCKYGADPMICHYDFVLNTYASMSTHCANCPFNLTNCYKPGCIPAEGRKKALFLVNKQLPGPSIEVCKGDRIVVELTNELPMETTSIHWHGFHQRETPFMDGVPYITQCPIPPGHIFRYNFTADMAGTFFWHSHSNEQRGEGMFGPLIVSSSPSEDPSQHLYDHDHEHILTLTDWTRIMGTEVLALDLYVAELTRPHSILVNGQGRYLTLKNKEGIEKHMPTAVFEVEKGKRYRFRIINAGVQDCPMEMTIDNHTMLVINSDGSDIEPVEVDSIRILSGERYDVVVSLDKKIDNYWIRFRGKDGAGTACDVTKAHQVAILRYKGAPIDEPSSEVNYEIPSMENLRQLNPYNKGFETPSAISVPTLNSVKPNDETSKEKADQTFYLFYDDHDIDEKLPVKTRLGMWQFNDISFKPPPYPLLTQSDMINPDLFCNSNTVSNCSNVYCSCTHVLNVEVNNTVEIIIVDEGSRKFSHPLHMHGHHFRVLAMEKINGTVTIDEIKNMDRRGEIYRKLNSAPLKDTVMAPSGGYLILRFYADNTGYWFFHCHFEMHSDIGMAVVFKVGNDKDFPKPPDDFPRCDP